MGGTWQKKGPGLGHEEVAVRQRPIPGLRRVDRFRFLPEMEAGARGLGRSLLAHCTRSAKHTLLQSSVRVARYEL